MVSYIRSDLDFILAQIKIAEAHASGTPLYGPGGLIPTYNLAWGLRTVDGTYNNLLHPTWGSADQPFPEGLGTDYRPADGTPLDMDGPGGAPPMATAPNYNPSNNPGSIVVDPALRTISNLIVDQTLGNPSAILTALQRAGIVAPADQMTVTAQISAAYAPLRPLFDDLGDAERAFANASAAAAASPGNAALQAAAAAAQADVTSAQAALDAADGPLLALLDANGIVLEGANVSITNTAPDEGLSAPFNSWFTLFGQFFDHGLDLINKGGSGTVFIPLQPDDPLFDPTSPTNFMVLTRATVGAGVDGIMGTADDTRPVNTTTPFVDQNQTYTSHSSHQVFLRGYVLNAAGDPVSTGKLIEGGNGGMATWADVKAQAADLLGIQLIDSDVGNIPLLAADQYGNFIPGPNGYPQMVFPGATPGTFVLVEGNPAANGGLGVLAAGAIRTGHAFLADIAHSAVPTGLADGDIEIGLGNPDNSPTNGQYDNELLDAHFIAGDGRANENIGLTAVHHVFHSEHNRLVEHTKTVTLADATTMLANGASQAEAIAFLNEWLIVDVASVPDTLAEAAALVWDGERLFQAAKFGTEMQYQHLVFEEFARKIQPNINVFLVPDGYDVTINPDIVAEFAHVVYRFGHSMLTETIDRFDPTFTDNDVGLIEGFLNPLQFETNGTGAVVDADVAAGAIIRGMTRQVGNQIDEFVTSALRNNLLGLPLDLATINLARGRDTGVPSLNATRREFYEATNEESLLKPYESWVDFAGHLKNEASIINFVAAYGTHSLITDETTVEGKRDAALTLITGIAVGKFALIPGFVVPADAVDFLNATGAYAGGALGGLENIDLWIGGLAEEIMPFGGMLGSTFNFVFETQMEKLQNGDRFYYLQRLDGLHLFSEMEANSFASLIMRNTDATHLPSDVFSTPGLILEVDRTRQYNEGLGETAGADTILLDDTGTAVNEAADNLGNDPLGGGILTPLVIRNNPATVGLDNNYLRYTGDEHVVLGGTEGSDILIASIGDDTLFGDGGNDRLEGGFGNDIINGGAGDDIIRDAGGDDNIKGGEGNDVINAGNGLDLVLAGAGQDFVVLGTDMGSEVFGGEGNDFILGNKNAERLLGNEGDDWLETGTFDGAPGDNFDEIFAQDGIDGHDVFLGDGGFDEFIGEGGDDIMVGSAGRGKMAGMSGFDWATYKDNVAGVNADLSIPIIFDEAPTLPPNAALDEFESMEGLSGSKFNDVLAGTDDIAADRATLAQGGTTGYRGSVLDAQGIALINGLQELLGAGVTSFDGGDIILGGDGSDIIRGNAGDDIIDGDKWLDVQIGVFAANDPDHTGTPLALHNSMTTLVASMFNGAINPGQLAIVRTVRNSNDQPDSDGIADVDRAVFSGARAEYDIGFNADGTVTVAHTGGLATDGTDTVRNVEVLDFTDQDISLVRPTLDLHGDVTTTTTVTTAQAYRDTFDTPALNNSNGTVNWTTPWVEAGDSGGVTTGQIQLDAGGGGGSNELRFLGGAGSDGASIARTVNLSGLTTATLSFDYDRFNNGNSIDTGETIEVQYSATGSFTPGSFTVLQTIGSGSGDGGGAGSSSLSLNLTGAGANSAIRFVSSAISTLGEEVRINNLNIATTTTTTTTVPGTPGNDYETTFTENGTAVAIAAGAVITDDGTTIASARVVLTNASAGDVLSVLGGLSGGISSSIDASVAGQITLNLTGTSSFANYRTAIQQVRYASTSENPNPADRILQVTVNDGLLTSSIATTTVNIVPTNDAPVANTDTVITNVASGVSFSIARSALLANDTDPEGTPVTITAVNNTNGLNAVLGATVTVTDTGGAGGSFNYVASDGTASDLTTAVNVNRVTGAINGGAGNEIIVGDLNGTAINGGGGNDNIDAGDGGDTITGGLGDDIIQGGTGNDTITWNANAAGDTDGFDLVDGGAGATDTFVLNGRAGTAETFRIYAKADAIAAGFAVAGADTEILITRTVGGTTTVIAELDNIEEIRVNTQQVTSPGGTPPGGTGSDNGDTIQVIGNFNTPFTSLNFNTITIDGNAGDDTVDISALTSAHRIVFKSNGGHDTIIGTLRPQDVIELPDGTTLDDYVVSTDANGVTTMAGANHSIHFTSQGGMPQFGSSDDDEEEGGGSPVQNGPGAPFTGTAAGDVILATSGSDLIVGVGGEDYLLAQAGADVVRAGAGDDYVSGGAGADMIFGEAGDDDLFGDADNDMIYGDAGDDLILGGDGDDLITGGSGDDSVIGGAGNDLFVAGVGDGNDTYYGDAMNGGLGVDTLDMAAITANISVNLGVNNGHGSATSAQSGTDALYGIENVVTGNGADTITASNGINVMDGGEGNDTFVFSSASAADGDTILGFEAGDKIDLTGIDANAATGANDAFTLVTGVPSGGTGSLALNYETREDGEYTVLQGNVNANGEPEFRLSIAGHVTSSDINL